MSNKGKAFFSLVGAALVFALLPRIPFGHAIQWPFVMLTTYVHEVGHGLIALAQGGNFITFQLWESGGGVATVNNLVPGWGIAAVSAGGLLAPPLMGGLFILAGRSRRTASIILVSFSLFMLMSCLIWIRSVYTLAWVGGLGILFLYFGIRTKAGWHQFLIQFFAVHMLMDTLTRTMRYLFTDQFERNGVIRHSDTSNIADALGGSYWMWGCLVAIIALSILYICFQRAYLR